MLTFSPPSPPMTETWALDLLDVTAKLGDLGTLTLNGLVLLRHTVGPTEPETVPPPDSCQAEHIHTAESAFSSPEESVALSLDNLVGECMARLRASGRPTRILFVQQLKGWLGPVVWPEVRENQPDLDRVTRADRQDLALCLWGLRQLSRRGLLAPVVAWLDRVQKE